MSGLVCGIDEAGRGPLAGPVAAAAVILPEPLPRELEGLDDSKKLSPKRREAFEAAIKAQALAWAVAGATVEEVEEHNILGATKRAMRRALEALTLRPKKALVDGNADPGLGLPTECIVNGDAKVKAIAAASILAKVARDRWMLELDAAWPGYGFAVHKGYGTQAHRRAILEKGSCAAHRSVFLRRVKGGG